MSRRRGLYQAGGKRLFDLLLATLLLPIALPLSSAVAIAVRLGLGSPVLFRQARIGKDGSPFTLVKFRTMRVALARDGSAKTDADRLSPLGVFLRRTSLDELPELVHVFSGKMSLVGPRPLLPEYLPRYSRRQSRRHEVRPGLTGLAQIRGRNALDWAEKLELDVVYVEQLRLTLDLSILVGTLWTVLQGRGVAASGHATMPEFMGNEPDSNSKEHS